MGGRRRAVKAVARLLEPSGRDKVGPAGAAVVNDFLTYRGSSPGLLLEFEEQGEVESMSGTETLRTTITSLAVTVAAGVAAFAAAPSAAQAAEGRHAMEQCVDRVLSRLTRSKAGDAQVGPAVLSECDQPLRLVLADAIESGEAPGFCKVAFCLDIARSRAAQEATAEFRRRVEKASR